MTSETINILTNAEAIAINQDSLGVQAIKYSSQDSVDTWFKPLDNGEWAVCFLNRDVVAKDIHFKWSDHVVVDDVTDRKLDFSKQEFQIRDVWSKQNLGTTGASLRHTVQGHDVLMLRLH
jgi:alpha-galactosidase